jgi:hypothetical protein
MFPWSTIINQVLPADNWVRSPRSSRQQPKRVAGKFRWLNDDNMQPNQTCPNAVHICARVAQIIGLKHQVLIFFLQVWSLWHHGISRGVVSHTLRRSFKIKWTNFGERNVFTVCIPTSILTYARPILTWDCQVYARTACFLACFAGCLARFIRWGKYRWCLIIFFTRGHTQKHLMTYIEWNVSPSSGNQTFLQKNSQWQPYTYIKISHHWKSL